MKLASIAVLTAVLAIAAPTLSSAGEGPKPQIKVLESALDPTKETVLIGRTQVDGMIIQLELEPAKGMWMQMGNPLQWGEHAAAGGELYHVEVKPIDPRSGTRISYASVQFVAVNSDTGQRVEGFLHPMWGGSGLHYALNSGLAGDGAYEAAVTVGVPVFARDLKNADLWMEQATANFHFKIERGMLVHVSEPTVD